MLKDPIELMAYNPYGKMVLVTALDVCDDTKMSSKAILHELLSKDSQNEPEKLDRLEQKVVDRNARLPIWYPMVEIANAITIDADKAILAEVQEIKKTTSKKDNDVRRKELLEYISPTVLELVAKRAENLTQTNFGCQFITRTLLGTDGAQKDEAKAAVASLAAGDPFADGHIAKNAPSSRMLKTLVTGGTFDPATQEVMLAEPRLGFGEVLYPIIKDRLVDWACSGSSFVVVAVLESEDVPEKIKKEVLSALKKERSRIEDAVKSAAEAGDEKRNGKERFKEGAPKGNAGLSGMKILLEKMD